MSRPFTIVVAAPATGILGLMGPSTRAAAMMAASDIEADGGILGRPIVMRTVDAGRPPAQVLQAIRRAAPDGLPDLLIGTHPSYLREYLARRIEGRFAYVYTPYYEGDERRPGIYPIGETPEAQLRPPFGLIIRRTGVRRWYVIGHDYVWPRQAGRIAGAAIADAGASVVGEHYVSLRRSSFADDLRAIAATGAEGVACFLIGQGAVDFHRAFAAHGLAETTIRFAPDIDENHLLALGEGAAPNLFTCCGYFESLATADNFSFLSRYRARFGALAPIQNSYSESLVLGLNFAKALVERAGGTDVPGLERASDGLTVAGPRGRLTYAGKRMRHPTHLAVPRNGRLYVTDHFAAGP